MNADELQLHLSDLGQLLRNAGGRKTGDALAEFCQRLQPYRERRLQDLMDLLDKAEEIVRTGTPGTPLPRGRGRAPKNDPEVVERICNRIVDLYNRAKEPEVSREQIETAFVELEGLNLTVAQLQYLASRIDIQQKLRAKRALVDRMKTTILERKGAFDRVQV